MNKKSMMLLVVCILLFGRTEGQEKIKESECDQANSMKSEEQEDKPMQVPKPTTAEENKVDVIENNKEISMQSEDNIEESIDKKGQEIYERIIKYRINGILKTYDLKITKEQELKKILLKELQELFDKKNATTVHSAKQLNDSAQDIKEIEKAKQMIHNESLCCNSLAELNELEHFLQSNANTDLQTISKRLKDRISELKKTEEEFSKDLEETREEIITALHDVVKNIHEGTEYKNMTIKQKTSAIDYLKDTIERIAVENNLEKMGWYQSKPSIKTVEAIIANVDFNPHNLKSLSYNAKAVSSLVYDKSYVAGCALDGNINTGWVSKGKTGYLNVSYQDVEKPIKKIYFVMRRIPFGSSDPIYKANITINSDIKTTTGRINNNEILLIELTKPIILENINFVIVDGKNNPGVFEIFLYP
jgi:hypothetical protein